MIKENDIVTGNHFVDVNRTIMEIVGIEHSLINHTTQVYYIYLDKPNERHSLGLETFRRLDIKPL